MVVKDEINQFTDWDTTKNLYIKCQDKYGNQPDAGECSLVVRAFGFFGGE